MLNTYSKLSKAPIEKHKDVDNTNSHVENLKKISNRYGGDFINALKGLFFSLSGNELQLDNTIDFLNNMNKLKEDLTKKFLYALVFPEKSKGCRIPTKFPVPSTTFQQSDFLILTPNSSGNFVVQWCPQNLSASTGNNEVVYNVNASLLGNNADTNYTTASTLTNSSVTNWQAFRVVSACMIVQYIGSYLNLQGILGGGLDISTSTSNSYDANYSIFSNIDDRLWSQTVKIEEGLKVSFFPKDYADYSFVKPNVTPTVNNMSSVVRLLVYGQNIPTNSGNCIRIDFIKNLEAIPGPALADIVEAGYLETDTMNEYGLNASKILTGKNIATTKLSEQNVLGNVLQTKGQDYMNIMNKVDMSTKNTNRKEHLELALEDAVSKVLLPRAAIM
jgi:hypothetical protein